MRKMKTSLSYKKANKLLEYDSKTGIILWKINVGSRAVKGREAGTPHSAGYRHISVSGTLYLAHRLAWLLHHRGWPPGEIDHDDGNRLNNRIKNLKCGTSTDNNKNSSKMRNNTSGVNGVSWAKDRNKWTARIGVNYVYLSLGVYESFFDAVCARKSANVKYGFHKNHGRQKD